MVRALYADYNGPLYLLNRTDDNQTKAIGVLSPGGVADAAAQDTFCAGAECLVEVIFDQTPLKNHLARFGNDGAVNASAAPTTLGGRNVYGAWVDPYMGYRCDTATGIAKGDDPESMYMVGGRFFLLSIPVHGASGHIFVTLFTQAPAKPFDSNVTAKHQSNTVVSAGVRRFSMGSTRMESAALITEMLRPMLAMVVREQWRCVGWGRTRLTSVATLSVHMLDVVRASFALRDWTASL